MRSKDGGKAGGPERSPEHSLSHSAARSGLRCSRRSPSRGRGGLDQQEVRGELRCCSLPGRYGGRWNSSFLRPRRTATRTPPCRTLCDSRFYERRGHRPPRWSATHRRVPVPGAAPMCVRAPPQHVPRDNPRGVNATQCVALEGRGARVLALPRDDGYDFPRMVLIREKRPSASDAVVRQPDEPAGNVNPLSGRTWWQVCL
jgi:hypothetical protein